MSENIQILNAHIITKENLQNRNEKLKEDKINLIIIIDSEKNNNIKKRHITKLNNIISLIKENEDIIYLLNLEINKIIEII